MASQGSQMKESDLSPAAIDVKINRFVDVCSATNDADEVTDLVMAVDRAELNVMFVTLARRHAELEARFYLTEKAVNILSIAIDRNSSHDEILETVGECLKMEDE